MGNRKWTKDEVLAEIGILRQEVGVTGSADSEPSALSKIIIDVRNDLITPEEGLTQARAIMASRYPDH